MGCDIHLLFEKKNKEGKWEKLDIPECLIPDDRNYDVFCRLAAVRGNIDPLFPHRGIPEDCSDQYIFGNDYHSHTYFYLDEIREEDWNVVIDDEYNLNNSYFYIFCIYVLPRIACRCGWCNDEEKRNIRCVMAFDS